MKSLVTSITFITALLCAKEPLALSHNETAFALFDSLDAQENVVISPISITSCLYMAYAGTRGETEKTLAKALSLPVSQESLPAAFQAMTASLDALHMVNSVWVSDRFFPLLPYRNTLIDHFKATTAVLSFVHPPRVVDRINAWVEAETEGIIPTILKPGDIDQTTCLILTNATYLKANWKSPFDTKGTIPAPFYAFPDEAIDVEMMHQQHKFPYHANAHGQFIALPLEGNISMVVYLPDGQSAPLTSAELLDAIDHFQPQLINLHIPKFQCRYSPPLTDALRALGMGVVFTPAANFSGISPDVDLFVSKIVHEAAFECGEEGVVATGATAAPMSNKTLLPTTATASFNANHPFFYFLMDMETKMILFMGKYVSP